MANIKKTNNENTWKVMAFFTAVDFACIAIYMKVNAIRLSSDSDIVLLVLFSLLALFMLLTLYTFRDKKDHQQLPFRPLFYIAALTVVANLMQNLASSNVSFKKDNSKISESKRAAGENDMSGEIIDSFSPVDKHVGKYEEVENYVVGWGDNNGGRETYTIAELEQGALGEGITFNSISDPDYLAGKGVISYETNFVGARDNSGENLGARNIWNGNELYVENGQTYLIRLYVHNNAATGTNTVAEGVRIQYLIEEPVYEILSNTNDDKEGRYTVAVYGFVDSTNSNPTSYWDGVKLYSDRPFYLKYINGSALYENNAIGKDGGYPLSDDVVMLRGEDHHLGGVAIGYDRMNGRIPGGYEYSGYALITVMPVFE